LAAVFAWVDWQLGKWAAHGSIVRLLGLLIPLWPVFAVAFLVEKRRMRQAIS
jgi:hypothetical protein